MNELYIGLMSGTSLDGIDAVLVDFNHAQPKIVASQYNKFTPELRNTILSLCRPGTDEINRLGELDVILGKHFAETVKALLEKNNLSANAIRAIGSHGQTIRHHPERQFTLQIGDPNIIAAKTGITTIADFRRRDIALGGQGAPLVPAFHQAIFAAPDTNRIILNIGGIANITLLPRHPSSFNVLGFDTGPGNILLDAWAEKHLRQPFDKNGEWAAQGNIITPLLEKLLVDHFFQLSAPKSTGREYFHLDWLKRYLAGSENAIDIQTTLTELTARTIANAIKKYFSDGEVLICGGGAHNLFLINRLRENAKNFSIDSTEKYGISPDWVEATAFAWLAKQTCEKRPGNLTSVTGATKKAILGGIYHP